MLKWRRIKISLSLCVATSQMHVIIDDPIHFGFKFGILPFFCFKCVFYQTQISRLTPVLYRFSRIPFLAIVHMSEVLA